MTTADEPLSTITPLGAAPASTDLFLTTHDPSGTPLTRTVTGAELAEMVNAEAQLKLLMDAAVEKTIASGVVAVTQTYIKLQPESGTTDDMTSVSGMVAGQAVIFEVSDEGTDTITIKHGAGINCPGGTDIALSYGGVWGMYDGSVLKILGGGGGSASPLTTKGDVYVYGSANARLPVGTNNQVLTADSTQTLGVKWADAAAGSTDGWTAAGETWTYSSVDDPTGVFTVSGNVTTKYCAGMRLKMTNGGNTIYGIISKAPTYSSPNTTITFLHEIDPTDSLALYLMANSAITYPYYSREKVPFGFPISNDKWTIIFNDVTRRAQATPTASTWYNPGSLTMNCPIGVWMASFKCCLSVVKTSTTYVGGRASLSTANNSPTIPDFLGFVAIQGPTGTLENDTTLGISTILSYTSKTPLYPIFMSSDSASNLQFLNDIVTMIISLRCAYL